MSNENYERVLEKCEHFIKEFARCGLRDDVERRIFELVQEWEKRKDAAEKEGKLIGGLGTIYLDLKRAVSKADADSERFGTQECEYFRRWLSVPFTEKGGLGYWASGWWK